MIPVCLPLIQFSLKQPERFVQRNRTKIIKNVSALRLGLQHTRFRSAFDDPPIIEQMPFFGSGLIPSYSAAKGAIVQLTKSMAIELAPHNIQVNAIAPGWIETDMTAALRTLPLNDEILARTPAGRWGQPEELAGTAVYLASRASDFVTGTTIRVDGGYAIR